MQALNLIPERDKKSVRKEAALLMFVNLVVWLLLMMLVVGIVLSWGKFFLERKLAEVQERSVLISEERLALGDEIQRINSQVKDLDQVQGDFIRWSELLAELAELVPAGSSLSLIKLNAPDSAVTLQGFSSTREDLLLLESKLQSARYFTDLESPLSNLLSPVDIAFEFSAGLELDSLETERLDNTES